MEPNPKEILELTVKLDQLIYQYDPVRYSTKTPHAFIYYLTIENNSQTRVILTGRKWIVEYEDGETQVIEGDQIVGKSPTLYPGDSFSYNSFHLTDRDAMAFGSFHGIDEHGNKVFTRIPAFELKTTNPEKE